MSMQPSGYETVHVDWSKVDLLSALKQTGTTKSVMVITFYKAQMLLLHSKANDAGIEFNQPRSPLRIVTVDASQGSEADIVILSCVRSNDIGNVRRHLNNANRMCVAVSRGREHLIIVGCKHTLRFRRVVDGGPSFVVPRKLRVMRPRLS